MPALQWLYECAAAREVVALMPRHYINISAATLESMDDVSRFCDPCAFAAADAGFPVQPGHGRAQLCVVCADAQYDVDVSCGVAASYIHILLC